MQHDGSNGARARSARIRSSHDYEATELDTMRRTSAALGVREHRSLATRLVSLFGRTRGLGAGTGQTLEHAIDPEALGGVNLND